MTAVLHECPRWETVAYEQVRVVGLRLRSAGILLLVLLLLVGAFPIAESVRLHGASRSPATVLPNFTFTPEMSVVFTFVALLLPLMVWQDEDPTRRTYHWLMPLSRHAHTAAKVFGGWVWLMLLTVTVLFGLVALVGLTSRVTGTPQPYHAHFSAWEWLVPVTSATIAYVLSSAAAVWARRPIIWLFGAGAIHTAVVLLLVRLQLPEAAASVRAIRNGRYGIGAAINGDIVTLDAGASGTLPDVLQWLGASLLWGAIAVGLLWLVSTRHRELR